MELSCLLQVVLVAIPLAWKVLQKE